MAASALESNETNKRNKIKNPEFLLAFRTFASGKKYSFGSIKPVFYHRQK
jgi:hypothetical protein